MWLPFILLALMASGSACPDLCECHQSGGGERDLPVFVRVKCRGRAPGLSELPARTRSLAVDSAYDYEVIGLFEELEVSETLSEFQVIGTSNVERYFDVNDTAGDASADPDNATTTIIAAAAAAATTTTTAVVTTTTTSTTTTTTTTTTVAATTTTTTTTILLPYLDELSVTNCSLVFLNVSWHGFERVTALNLSRNNLARLNDVTVGRAMNMSELTRFDLSDNSLTDVSAGAFRTLAGLVRLSLRRNAISNVHEDAFRGLDRLEFLDLSDNRLADLPDSALTPLYSLQKLDLSGNQLQVLGARWFESLDRLRELDVSRNGLARAASGTLQPLPGLSILKLSENPLKERDVSLLLGTGRRLETVDASRTGLARVPAALTRSVRALRLAGNKLTTIRGGDLDSYPLLRILDISENRLTDIEDDALGRLEVLEELDISGNVLAKVPGSLPNSLTSLKLERNAIGRLRTDDLQGLYNLRSLTLNDNDIEEIEVGALGQLPVLEELDLSDNPVKTLPANTLSGPSNLAKLRMAGLTSLRGEQQEQSDMAFPVPTPERLVYLDVSRSPVLARQLLADDAALSACKSLVELNLSRTNLTSLRFDLPYMLPQLRVLDLAGNRWNCSEDLYWLGEWVRQHERPNKDVRCDAPGQLSGSPLYELPSPPSPPPTAAPPTVITPPTATTLSIPPPIERSSRFNNPTASSNASTTRPATVASVHLSSIVTEGAAENRSRADRDRPSLLEDSSSIEGTSTRPVPPPVGSWGRNGASFVGTTRSGRKEERDPAKKVIEVDRSAAAEIKNSIIDVGRDATSDGKPSIIGSGNDSGTLDNRVEDGSKQGGSRGPSKLGASSAKTAATSSFFKLSKLGPPLSKEQPFEKKYWTRRRANNPTRESSAVLLGGENNNRADSNTIAEELNDRRATDSDARVSEALSAGAHPGMLVLAGAALGAAAALTVVLSRRATVRRRDRYHRHENIEVHTLTPTTELW